MKGSLREAEPVHRSLGSARNAYLDPVGALARLARDTHAARNAPAASSGARELPAETFRFAAIADRSDETLDVAGLRMQSQKLETIGALAGGVAHEFNNLLQAMLGYTRFALSSLDDSHPAHRDLLIAVSAAERAAALTRQLLKFTRDDPQQAGPMDANAAVRECAALLRPLLGERIDFELALGDRIAPILCDENQFQQMLMNLCLNARDAMPHGGKIVVSTSDSTMYAVGSGSGGAMKAVRCLELSVQDTGCGLSPEIQRRIFEPFFTTKPVGKGTGLGLPMVREVAQRHGGTVEVESEVGSGTRFVVRLPFAGFEDSRIREPSPDRAVGTALLADDEPLVLTLAQRMLEAAGFRVLTAIDGREALDLLRSNQGEIDVVVLDAGMPRLSGWDVLREVRTSYPGLPVVIATGHEAAFDAEPGLAARILSKPFANEDLVSAIRDVLEGVKS